MRLTASGKVGWIVSIDIAKRRIIQKVPLASLIGEKVELTRRSSGLMGCCPFHSEKTASFIVYDDHYHCFGCGKHGDAIEYTRHDQGLGFIETLRYLASKYSVEIPELDINKQQRTRYSQEAVFYQIHQEAQRFFVMNLESQQGQKAIDYLEGRGFNATNIKEFQFGLSLDTPFALTSHLTKAGFSLNDVVTCSLVNRSEKSGSAYDFFRNRIMIPIYDKFGRIIAFGGRTLGDDPAKYKNSRETPIFDKSSTVYGLHHAKDHIRKKGRVIIVEGYMDALQLWNHGFDEAVACMGTALTLNHLQQLSQLTHQAYLSLDGDSAGQRASLKTVSTALSVPSLTLKVVSIPDNNDPDDFLRSFGAEKFSSLMGESRELLDYAMTETFKGTQGLAIIDVLNKKFLPWLRSIVGQVSYVYLAHKVAQLSGIPYDELDRLVKEPSGPNIQSHSLAAQQQPAPRQEVPKNISLPSPLSPEFTLLGHLYFSSPGETDEHIARNLLKNDLMLSEPLQDLGERLLEILHKEKTSPATSQDNNWMYDLHPQLIEFTNTLKQHFAAFDGLNRGEQLQKLSVTLRLKRLKATRTQLKNSLHQRGSDHLPHDEMTKILSAISQITTDIVKLERGGG